MYDGQLDQLRGRFNTLRTITADYRWNSEPFSIPGCTVQSWSPERVVLSVDTEQIKTSDVITILSGVVELVDISIESQPIEDIIVQLYKEYQI